MNRRKFLYSVSGLLVCAGAKTSVRAELSDHWWQEVKSVQTWTAFSDDKKLRLEVTLFVPAEDEVKSLSKKGHFEGNYYRGKKLPKSYWPGKSLLTQFDFYWEKEKINIPRRFWEDVCHLEIRTIQVDQASFSAEQKDEYEKFVSRLKQPRIYMSADEGTALIEWGRGEECDNHSTIRWIISKSGSVLRHTLTPPDEC